MRRPLHPDMYDTTTHPQSWWRAETPLVAPRAALEGEARADVAVIGAGYAGLSCAAALAERGVDVVALDAGEVGWGASGRNGGVVGLTSDSLSAAQRVARVGEAETRRAFAAQIDGAHRLRAFCESHHLPIQGDAEVVVAHSPRAFRALREATEDKRWGPTVETLDQDAYAERGFSGPQQHGVALTRPGFGVHPLRLVRAIAAAAERNSVRIFEHSPVRRWRREGPDHLLETPGGALRAASVVLAMNGFATDDTHPGLTARFMPVISMIGVTRPLSDDELARHRWSEDSPLCNTRRMLYYWRMLPERRLLFGMRGDLTGAGRLEGRWRARLAAHMGGAFPGWRDIPLTHFWRGPICATRAFAPAVGRMPDDPTVFHAFGWHGSGVNGAQVAGRMLAQIVAGAPETVVPALWRGLPPRIPLPGLRSVWLGATLALFNVRDRLEAN